MCVRRAYLHVCSDHRLHACSFGDYQLLYGREVTKAELENLADHVQRQWHAFLELQNIARIVEAHRKVAAAAARGSPAPAEAVQTVLREAAALQWLPRSPEQVSVCTRRAKSMLQPYQRDLLPATLVAVASALAGDAKTKQDPRLAQVRTHRLRHRLRRPVTSRAGGQAQFGWPLHMRGLSVQHHHNRCGSADSDMQLIGGCNSMWACCRRHVSRRHCLHSLRICSTVSKVRTSCHKRSYGS